MARTGPCGVRLHEVHQLNAAAILDAIAVPEWWGPVVMHRSRFRPCAGWCSPGRRDIGQPGPAALRCCDCALKSPLSDVQAVCFYSLGNLGVSCRILPFSWYFAKKSLDRVLSFPDRATVMSTTETTRLLVAEPPSSESSSSSSGSDPSDSEDETRPLSRVTSRSGTYGSTHGDVEANGAPKAAVPPRRRIHSNAYIARVVIALLIGNH